MASLIRKFTSRRRRWRVMSLAIARRLKTVTPERWPPCAQARLTVQVPDLRPPSAQTLALGHVVADDLYAGALRIGLIAV